MPGMDGLNQRRPVSLAEHISAVPNNIVSCSLMDRAAHIDRLASPLNEVAGNTLHSGFCTPSRAPL